jgi:hypothetical protein
MPVALVNSLAAISHQVWSVLHMALRLPVWADAVAAVKVAAVNKAAVNFRGIGRLQNVWVCFVGAEATDLRGIL